MTVPNYRHYRSAPEKETYFPTNALIQQQASDLRALEQMPLDEFLREHAPKPLPERRRATPAPLRLPANAQGKTEPKAPLRSGARHTTTARELNLLREAAAAGLCKAQAGRYAGLRTKSSTYWAHKLGLTFAAFPVEARQLIALHAGRVRLQQRTENDAR